MPLHAERTYAVADANALLSNLDALRSVRSDMHIMAVVKDGCYGHGEKLCEILENKVDALGVSTAEEGLRIRKICPKIPILVFGYVPPAEIESLIRNNISVSVYSATCAESVNVCAENCGGKITAHLKINTGMNRLGVKYDDHETLKKILGNKNIIFSGIFSHFAAADGNTLFTTLQNERFAACAAFCRSIGYDFEFEHIGNSAAAETGNCCGNTVRLGYGLYGYGGGSLSPVLSWYARVVQTRYVDCGESVSYGLAYTAEKKILEATISVGYGDGYPRSLSNCGKVLYNGVFLPIIGRVCMDMTMIDASGAPNLSEGDYVTLIGKSGDKKIEAEDLGFGYEILCKISPRVKRYII